MAKAKKFIVGLDSEVTAISLVEMPAIEEDYILLAKEPKKKMFLGSEEKRICLGPVLIPNRPIYRYSEDIGDYYIEFGKEVIEKLAFDFLKNRLTNSLTLDHQTEGENLSVVESWIKTTENDKSNDLGFNLPIGTWFASVKVNDEETWNRVKNEELNGFSVESFVELDEIKLNKIIVDNNMKNESLLEEIKNIIQECFKTNFDKKEEDEKEEEIEETPTDETEDEEKKEKCEEVDEIPTEEVPTEAIVEEVVDTVEEISVDPQEDLQEIIDALQDEVNALKDEIEGLKKENEKLSKQPSVKKVNVVASSEKNFPSFLDFASGKIKY